MIDAMAERYSMLPTDIMDRATTFDLFVYDTIVGYKNAKLKEESGVHETPQVSEEKMVKAYEQMRKRNQATK
jgi:hypothetical protein